MKERCLLSFMIEKERKQYGKDMLLASFQEEMTEQIDILKPLHPKYSMSLDFWLMDFC